MPGVTFTGVAIAVAPSTYNQSEVDQPGPRCLRLQRRQHLGQLVRDLPSGHALENGNYVHPVDQNLGSDIATNYNAYVKSGDLTGGGESSFTSLVPFVENTGDIATLQSHAKNDNIVPERSGDHVTR